MKEVTVAFADETLERLDRLAEEEFGGDRDAAAQALLAEWRLLYEELDLDDPSEL